jgi:hypothetical protein
MRARGGGGLSQGIPSLSQALKECEVPFKGILSACACARQSYGCVSAQQMISLCTVGPESSALCLSMPQGFFFGALGLFEQQVLLDKEQRD